MKKVKVKWCIYIAPLSQRLKGALQWSIYPQRTGSIYRRKLQPLLSSLCMLVLILPTSEGWKAEWTLAGKKVAKYSGLGRTGNGTRDLRVGRQRSYHCTNPSALVKIQDFNGVWTRDLAIPVRCSNQLSYEATDVGSWSFVGSNVSVRNESMIAQLVRALHWYCEVMGSNPVEVLKFSGFFKQLQKLRS